MAGPAISLVRSYSAAERVYRRAILQAGGCAGCDRLIEVKFAVDPKPVMPLFGI